MGAGLVCRCEGLGVVRWSVLQQRVKGDWSTPETPRLQLEDKVEHLPAPALSLICCSFFYTLLGHGYIEATL